MTFLNPVGLLGLLALPVIVFFHLRRERARQILVSSLDLWSFLETKHTGTRARYLPLTWLLLVHLLVAGLLSLAFSQPQLELPIFSGGQRHLIVLLDTSSSMLAFDLSPTRFDAARDDVRALLSSSDAADMITVITFGVRAEALGDSRQLDLASIVDELDELQAGGVGNRLTEALALAAGHASPDLPVDLRIFTDGAFPRPTIDGYPYVPQWESYGSESSNRAVIDVEVEVIGENRLQVYASVANYGGQAVQAEMTLFADGEEIDTTALQLPPDATTYHIWDLTGQPENLEVRLSSTDTLPADDYAYYSVSRSNAVNVALVSNSPEPLARAIQAAGSANVLRFNSPNFETALDVDLYVFRGWLPNEFPAGNVLIFDPPLENTLLPVENLQDLVDLPLLEANRLLNGVDFAGVRWGQAATFRDDFAAFDSLVTAGEIPILLRGELEDTQLVVFTPVLEDGNFTRHPAFPVLISNVVQSVRGSSLPSSLLAGQSFALPPDEGFPLVSVKDPTGEIQQLFSPRISGDFENTSLPGFYRVESVAQSGEIFVDFVGANAGELSESDLSQGDWLAEFEAVDVNSEPTTPSLDLTPWLLLVVFLFLAVEGWLAWR
ncbi:MAG: VWA domain-containing protein [Chloroflexi bacterium]|nr:MAG: VWA domain-containing protein [Chloroflexota bacterium]MBL1196005.1 VWA domain-containing protein [Chloroflexota bacterium]NOH13299.1 VWA domain-containing protein [Chloroflexota bacterium]